MLVSVQVAAIISQKKSRYGRYIDTKQWDKFDQVALPDADLTFVDSNGAILTIGESALAFSSSEAFTKFFGHFFANAETLHMFGPGELEQTAADEVKAIWGMEDQIIMKSTAGLVEVRGGGYYYETWRMKDGDWFLKSLRLERTYTKTSFMARVAIFLQKYLGLMIV